MRLNISINIYVQITEMVWKAVKTILWYTSTAYSIKLNPWIQILKM